MDQFKLEADFFPDLEGPFFECVYYAYFWFSFGFVIEVYDCPEGEETEEEGDGLDDGVFIEELFS